jgi:hypothetical protein
MLDDDGIRLMRNHGNRDDQFTWIGTGASASAIAPGNGLRPGLPIATHGGIITFVIDVDVPATLAAAPVDWSTTYPTEYSSPEPNFTLIRYAQPADSAKKLHGKGNLWIQKAVVMQGTALTGSGQWTQAGGIITMAIRTKSTLVNLWDFGTTCPVGQTIITPSNELAKGVIIGTDAGDDSLALLITPGGSNVTAGRLRILITAAEV